MKFLSYIKELFDTKNYKWTKGEFGKISSFSTKNKDYFIHFDLFMTNGYNIYFYYNDINGNPVYELIKDNSDETFKIISNVKNSIEDFILNNDVEFLGYSSYNSERHPLYMLMIQNLRRKNDLYTIKKRGIKTYYFLYDKKIEMRKDLYISRFMENDDKIKK